MAISLYFPAPERTTESVILKPLTLQLSLTAS